MDNVKTTFPVLSRIRHSGDVFNNGEFISLTEREAAPLLAIKAIGPANDAEDATNEAGLEISLTFLLGSLIKDGHDVADLNMKQIGSLLGEHGHGVKRKDVDAALAEIEAANT